MFENTKAYSGFAVDDLQKAQEFYGETLGLKTTMLDEENGLMSLELAGDRPTIVYRKPDFTPATYTILNFPVDDIDEAVDGLAARGVRFERYDASSRTRRASPAATARRSPGSRTPPATCCPCSRTPRRIARDGARHVSTAITSARPPRARSGRC